LVLLTPLLVLRLQREDQSLAAKGGAISQTSIDRNSAFLCALRGAEDVLGPE